MNKIREIIKNKFPRLNGMYLFFRLLNRRFPTPKDFGGFTDTSTIETPVWIECPQSVFIEQYARIRWGTTIINTPSEKVIVGKYSVIAPKCFIIPNSHRSTVGIPQCLLGISHINDKSTDIIIEEDVWVGAGAILLAGAKLRRGCVVAAGAIVSKEVPPYAVVAGVPAKIIAKKFELEDIILHEKSIYTEKDRMDKKTLESIFSNFFEGKRTFGVSTPLSDTDLELLTKVKTIFHYTESI